MGSSGVMGGEFSRIELTDEELAVHDAKTKITENAAAGQEATRDKAHDMANAGNVDMGIAARSEQHGYGELAAIQRSSAAGKEEAAGEEYDKVAQIAKETVPIIIAQITALDSVGTEVGIHNENKAAWAMIIDQLDKVLGVGEKAVTDNDIDTRFDTAIPGVCKVVSKNGVVKFEKYK